MGDEDERAIRRRRDRLIAIALSGAVGGLAGCDAVFAPCLEPALVEEPAPTPTDPSAGPTLPEEQPEGAPPVPCLERSVPDPEPIPEDPPPEVEPPEARPRPCLSRVRPQPCLSPPRREPDDAPDGLEGL